MSEPTDDLPPPLLIALSPDVQPQETFLYTAEITIGRARESTIVIRRPVVSRLHARIERYHSRYLLHDLQSVNGTFVHGRRIGAPHLLTNGDELGFGGVEALLRFVDNDSTELVRTPSINRLTFNEQTLRFSIDQQPVLLTPTLQKLLLFFYRHAGEVQTIEACVRAVWEREYNSQVDKENFHRTLHNLRARLRDVAPDQEWIVNQRGEGYLLKLD